MADISKLYPVGVVPALGLSNLLEGIRNNTNFVVRRFGDNVNTDPFHNTYIHIIQIGAGGTGGYVAAEIMRFLGNMPQHIQNMIMYTLVDGDEFEAKNLGRQLCTEEDLGVNKAEALIGNYGPYFNCKLENLRALPKYLKSIKDLEVIPFGLTETVEDSVTFKSKNGVLKLTKSFERVKFNQPSVESRLVDIARTRCTIIPIIIDCVDKTTPRKLIHDFLEQKNIQGNLNLITNIYALIEGKLNSDKGKNNIMKFFSAKGCIPDEGNMVEANVKLRIGGRDCQIIIDINGKELTLASLHDLILNCRHSIAPETYIISSGNGHFTGQVYWGRYCTPEGINPITYEDLYNDDIVSPLFKCTTGDDLASKFKEVWLCKFSIYGKTSPVATIDARDLTPEKLESIQKDVLKLWLVSKFAYATTPDETSSLFELNFEHGIQAALDSNTGEVDKNIKLNMSIENYLTAFTSIPSPYAVHPELIDVSIDEQEDQMSCAERAAQNVQNIAANKTAATLVMNYVTAIMNGLLPSENGSTIPITTGGVTFDVRNNNFTTEMLTVDYLQRYTK